MSQRKSQAKQHDDEDCSVHVQSYITPTMAAQVETLMAEMAAETGSPVTMAAVIRLGLRQVLKGRGK